jgi:hypothetical protein
MGFSTALRRSNEWMRGTFKVDTRGFVVVRNFRTADVMEARVTPCAYPIHELQEIVCSLSIGRGKTVRIANPMQTTGFFGMEKGFRGDGVDVGNPLVLSERFIGTRSI